jgi:tetratricopeptide (TPR) repeat protein
LALTSGGRLPLLTAAAASAASLGVYAATASRYPWWGDSAEFVTVARTLGIAHPPGYPLYTLLSALAVRLPLGTPFLRVSLLSAAFGSLAAGVAALTVWEATGIGVRKGLPPGAIPVRVAASLMAALSLAFSGTYWSQATVPEVYSLSAFLVLSVIYLTVVWLGNRVSEDPRAEPMGRRIRRLLTGDRPVPLIGFALGVAIAHHLTAVLVVPAVVFALSHRRSTRPSSHSVLSAVGLLALGLSFYVYLPIRAAQDPAVMWARVDSLPVFMRHVAGAQYASRLFAAPAAAVVRKLALFLRSLPQELSWPVLGLSAVGFWSLWRRSRPLAVVLAAEATFVLAHAMSYRILDIQSYYIPVYAMLALASGPGLVEVAGLVRRVFSRAVVASVAVAGLLAVAGPTFLIGANWSSRDLSRYCGAARYLDHMLDVIEPDGIVIALNDRTVFLLWYAHFVEGRRPDISIVDYCSLAPHVAKWFPRVVLPSEEQLSSEAEAGRVVGGGPVTLDRAPVVSYLRLLVSLNVGSSPVYADAEVAARRMPLQAVPRGLLARIMGEPIGPIPDAAVSKEDSLWQGYLAGLLDPCDGRPETVERYAKTLADQGRLRLERGELEDAVPLLETAARLAPDVPHIRNNLGAAYQRTGHTAEAMAEYRRAIDLDPGAAVSYRNVYVLLRDRGDLEQARAFLRTAWRLEPEDVGDLLDLAALDELLGEPGRAEATYLKAEKLAPESWEAEIAHADFLSRMERYSEALAVYQQAASRVPESSRLLRGLARCYWMLDRPGPAIEAIRRAVNLKPPDPMANYDLAVMLVRTGRANEAVPYLDEALRIDPHLWNARALKAGIFTDLGRIEEARSLFQRALRDGAGGPEFWSAWLNLERSAGDSAAVRALLRRMRAGEAGGRPVVPPTAGR